MRKSHPYYGIKPAAIIIDEVPEQVKSHVDQQPQTNDAKARETENDQPQTRAAEQLTEIPAE